MLVGQQIGPFEIEKELGSGAMGTVYKAKFRRNEEKVVPVALKVVALGLLGNEGAMARFEREATILKQLKHPHIVRLIAHGKINKANPYIAMEFIDGEALDRVLARRGKLGWEEVAAYGKQLCEALQYAHEKGIIHRDLKPSNLMITADGTLKLTDFGIAKDTDVTALTGANSTIGTAAYMSPEQCRGDRNLTNKSDLYSLGIVFFELLTGRKPFVAETTVEMFLKHVNERSPRVGKFVNELPPKFESLILQLLEKEKDDRPVDAAWVARMLGEIEDDAFARKSAGLSVAQARTAKPVNQSGDRMDAADKDAARALRGKKKKGKKKEVVPLLEQKWVHAVGLGLVLLVLFGGAFLALRPASAEKMFADLEKAPTPAERAEAAAKFLDSYGKNGGDLVDRAAAIFRDATVKDRDRQLLTRSATTSLRKPAEGDDAEAYDFAMLALDAEKDGNLALAEKQWDKVKARFPEEAKLQYTTDPPALAKARWGWVADKHVADLKAAEAELRKLNEKTKNNQIYEQSMKFDPASPESHALRVLRFQRFPDPDKAARTGDALLAMTEKDPESRVWYLVGSRLRLGRAAGAPEPLKVRLDNIKRWLDATQRTVNQISAEPDGPEHAVLARDARNRCREVMELYEDDPEPEVKELVQRAAKMLESLPKKQ